MERTVGNEDGPGRGTWGPGGAGRGVEVLDRPGCLAALRTVDAGHVGLSLEALPVVIPVELALVGEDVVVQAPPLAGLATALAGTVVAVQADGPDVTGEGRWSVVVQGVARPAGGTWGVLAHRASGAGRGPSEVIAVPAQRVRGWRWAQVETGGADARAVAAR